MADTVSTFDQVSNILQEQLGVESEDITPAANLVDDLGADSLDIIEISQVIEETFHIEVPDEDVEKMATVADIVQYVDKNT